MSAEPDNEYFCDGLSEELLNALAKIQDLKVAARTSAFSFKGKDTTVSGIGRALNVNTVLEGSVRKSGNRLRISVQLINCADGYHLWSERYDRQMQDIFDVQDEIALAIVDALKVKLLGKEKDAILKRYTDNVEAYQLYLKGRYYWWKTAPDEFRKSRDFFERAVQADPTYALSYAGISSYFGFGTAWGMVPPEIGWPKASEANDKSLALDNTLPEVHVNTAGIVMVRNRNFVSAERSIRRSIELNPNFQEAHYIYSFHLAVSRKFEESIHESQKALELDPFSVRLNLNLGMIYYLARKFDDAITQFKQAIELDPGNPRLHESLGDAYEQKHMSDDAIGAWLTAINISGDSAGAAELRKLYATSGFDSVLQAMSRARLEELTKKQQLGEYVPAIYFARAHTRLGNTEDALEWLSKSVEERNVFPLLVQADPLYDGLRSDQRFEDLLVRLDKTLEISKV
jgi:serine/threonine-protein kinase